MKNNIMFIGETKAMSTGKITSIMVDSLTISNGSVVLDGTGINFEALNKASLDKNSKYIIVEFKIPSVIETFDCQGKLCFENSIEAEEVFREIIKTKLG